LTEGVRHGMHGTTIARAHEGGKAWNAFVRGSAGASVFHLHEWKRVIRATYGHEAHYLTAEREGAVRGVLPLFLIDSRLFGRSLVSLPYADYGGIVANDDADAAHGLLEAALALGEELGAEYLLLRQTPAERIATTAPRAETYAGKVTMLLELSPDPQTMLSRLPGERRNRIRKTQRQGLGARWAGVEAVDGFYGVFAENMRDLGSPVHSKTLFVEILRALGDEHAKLLVVEHEGRIIGAAMCLFFGATAMVPWVSSLRSHFRMYPNVLLYWTALEYACERGCRIFDFGRSSPGSGTYEFKRQWGARAVELPWLVVPFAGHDVPSFGQDGLKERLLISCWKRLPLPVTRFLGPRVRGAIHA